MPAPEDIEVEVANGKVECGPQGGDRNADKGNKIKWKKKTVTKGFRFNLTFSRHKDSRSKEDWPFGTDPAPQPGNSSGWVNDFEGVVAVVEGTFKYSVQADDGSQGLDPMIIVGRV